MKRLYQRVLFLIFVIGCATLTAQNSQENLKIFLNCDYCDDDHIKQNLDYIEFVRDQNFSDVELVDLLYLIGH